MRRDSQSSGMVEEIGATCRQWHKKPGVFRVLSQRPKWAHPSAVLIAIEQPYWCRVDRQLLGTYLIKIEHGGSQIQSVSHNFF